MLFFDPTINWSRDLLEPPTPDLLVVQSEAPFTIDPPWHPSSGNKAWNSAWAEYAAVDRSERYIQFTFFDRRSSGQDEKRQISDYSIAMEDQGSAIGLYRYISPTSDFVEILSRGNTIQCHKRASPPDVQSTSSPDKTFVFQRMTYPSVRRPLDSHWAYLVIGYSDDPMEVAYSSSNRWEADIEPIGDISQEETESGDSSNQREAFTLYVVATSQKASPPEIRVEAPSGTPT